MKVKFLFTATAAALIAFSSCKKDDAPNPIPAPSKKLKKVTRTEAGVTTVFNLDYNTAGKLQSYKNTGNTEYVLFSYDAQGNLTGIEQKEDEFKNIYTYTYQNNLPVSGIFKSWKQVPGQPDELFEDDRLTYTVSNNQVSKIKLNMLLDGTENNMQLTYTGANLAKITGQGIISYTADFSFGTKHPAFPKVSNFVLDQAGFSLQFACNNEMLSASFDFPGTAFDKTIHTQYTYDSDGYVLTSNDGDIQMIFEYQ